MRFKFCGNRDVPDWVVAEVSVLSKISCVRMKLICKQVINELLGGQVDFAKVQRLVPRDKGFSTSDIRAALAAMNFVLRQASVNAVTDDVLNRELQQLGLPKENSDGISRPFRNNRDLLMTYNAANSLALPRPVTLDWRVDAVLASSETHTSFAKPSASVALRFNLTHRPKDAQPPPPAKPAVLSNPARHEAERAAEHAVTAAIAGHPDVAQAAQAVLVPPSEAVTGGTAAAVVPPTCDVVMSTSKYLAFATEMRRAAATMQAVLPQGEGGSEPGLPGLQQLSAVSGAGGGT